MLKISKIIKILCISCSLIVLGLVGITFVSVKKVCSRQPLSKEQEQKIDKKTTVLDEMYHAESIHVMTDDGLTLSGFLIPREHAQRVILLCHGYQGTKESMMRFINIFPHDTIACFDFRAHGQSEGNLITFGCQEERDINAIVSFLKADPHTKDLLLIGLGCSMGGAALLGATAHGILFNALIIDSSFANLYEQIAHVFTRKTHLPRIPCMFFAYYWFKLLTHCDIDAINPSEYARHITCPVLIIHSQDDDFTPVNHAYEVYDNLSGIKELYLVEGAEHGRCCKSCPIPYKQQIDQFLQLITCSSE